jgi:hypothetical protein
VVAGLAVVAMTTPLDSRGTGDARRFGYAGVSVGLLVSVAANIAHGFVPPAGWPPGRAWAPEPGAVFGAMFWPVALLLTTEILTRKRWPTGVGWLLVRLAGLLPVAVVAAVISYQHLHGLLLHYHETRLAAAIGPLSIDGLMVMASAALIAPNRCDPPATSGAVGTVDATSLVQESLASQPRAWSGSSRADASRSSSVTAAAVADSSRGSSSARSMPSSGRTRTASSRGQSPPSSDDSSSSAGRRADEETLRALVAQARSDRPGAGEPAVRRLLGEAGLSASSARVRAALAATTPVPGPSSPGDAVARDRQDGGEAA